MKSLLSHDDPDTQHLWREQQETLLRLLQAGNLQRLRAWIKEQGRDYPAQTLINHFSFRSVDASSVNSQPCRRCSACSTGY